MVAAAVGAVVLVPSLYLLFHLFLHGRLLPAPSPVAVVSGTRPGAETGPARGLAPFAAVCLAAGAALMVLVDGPWAHVVGVLLLFVCAVSAFFLATAAPEDA